MTDVIRHRGPDDEGFAIFNQKTASCALFFGADTPHVEPEHQPEWFPDECIRNISVSGHVGFGHRRLSILDLSPFGHQPMSYDTGRYWITYNGEVYNYLELRNELTSLGYKFASGTDTEVILASYAEWGEDCLARFNGMWAFAIYDTKENTVFLARDRFGVKPLYYWLSPHGVFHFGSEIKQFTVLPDWKAVLNPQRAYDFLVWGVTDHTDETLFDRVFHVRPGCYVTIDVNNKVDNVDGRVSSTRWYSIPNDKFSGSFVDAATKFKALLQDAVRLRLRSDVSVGSCLSGGLDSSSIVCLMHDMLRDNGKTNAQKTFSALSHVEKYNEQKWIVDVVEHTGATDYYTYPNVENLFDVSTRITWHQDEPFGSASIYAQWNVFELSAQNDVRVMLDGQGADEQLFGYHFSFGSRFGSLFLSGRWLQLVKEAFLFKTEHGRSYSWVFARTCASILPAPARNFLRGFTKYLTPDPAWIDWSVVPARKKSPFDFVGLSVRDCCLAQTTSTNLQMLLHWEDRNSMAHSIESRVPFLDYRLVEFSMSLPDDYKTRDAITKRVLREGMNGIIPNSIRDRMDKIGFATPEEIWVREKEPDLFRDKMKQAISTSKGVLNASCLNVLEDVIAGRRPFNFVIWRMINFGMWMDMFSVSVKADNGD